MDRNIINNLRKGLEVLDGLTPLAGVLGPQAAVIGKIAESLSDLAQAVLDRAAEGAMVMSSDDQAEIRHIVQNLANKNDALARRIAAS